MPTPRSQPAPPKSSEAPVVSTVGSSVPDGPKALDNRRMAGAAAVVMIFFVLSRVSGLLREIIIGAQFGTSAELDAYLAAFRLPDILFQLVAGGALGSAFIPTFAAVWAQGRKAAAWLLFSRVLNLVTLLLVLFAGIAALLAPALVQGVIAPGFDPEQQQLTAELMRWMLISTVIFGASGLVMGALNAVQHFVLPAAAPVLYNCAIILGAWLLVPRYGIYGLVAGVVVGAFAHFFVQVPGLWRSGVQYRPSLSLGDPGVREVGRLMAPRVLGLLFVQLNFLVNTILASGLAEGSLSALNYAWLLMLLPQGIFAQAIATVAFPTFAAQVAAGQRREMGRTLEQILRTVLFLTVPAAVVLGLMRFPIIQILLERGSFTSQSTRAVAYALQFYALGLVAHAVVEIVVRAFYALHDTLTPVLVGIGAMILNIFLSLWWINWLSYGGLALANSVATGLEMILLGILLVRRLQGFALARLGRGVVRTGLAAGGMALLLLAWLTWLGNRPDLTGLAPPGWVAAGSGLVVAGAGFVTISFLMRSEELQTTLALLRRRR